MLAAGSRAASDSMHSVASASAVVGGVAGAAGGVAQRAELVPVPRDVLGSARVAVSKEHSVRSVCWVDVESVAAPEALCCP